MPRSGGPGDSAGLRHRKGSSRRTSFTEFLLAPDGDEAKTAGVLLPDENVKASSWERLTMSANLLGFGLILSFLSVLVLIYISGIEYLLPNDRGDMVVTDNWALLRGLYAPYTVACAVFNVAFVMQQTSFDFGGREKAKISFWLWFGPYQILFYGTAAAMLATGVNARYYFGKYWLLCFAGLAIMLVDINLRGVGAEKSSATKQQGVSTKDGAKNKPSKKRGGCAAYLLVFLTLIATGIITVGYPLIVIPAVSVQI